MKGKMKRMVSGLLTAVTLFSSFMQPIASYAAEMPAEEKKPPLYQEVKDLLDADEVVKAKDYELEIGGKFDVKEDFSGLEIPDDKKVKVTFEEAKNDQKQDFTNDHADTYTAVYYVEPQTTDHPTYQISRKLIVKEPVTEKQSEGATEQDSGGGEDSPEDGEADSHPEMAALLESENIPLETQPETETELSSEAVSEVPEDALPEEALDAELEATQDQDTVDEETGLTLADVLTQGEDAGVELLSMEEGETLSFQVYAAEAKATQNVDVTRGTCYYYSDYGLGSYLTYKYTVKFGNITATAYCVQPSKPGPGDGNYTITKLADSKALAKVCYYGTNAAGDEGFFAEKHPDFSAGKRFIITHLAAAYANGSSDAFSGTNSTGQSLAMELYNYCMSQPEIPDVAMSFSKDNVKAYVDGNSQRTEEITFKADVLQTITMKLPDGVKLHNVTTGKTSAAGADVEICGGTKFYLSAPLTQVSDVAGSWSATMKGSITKDYSAYKITTGNATQDLALVFGEGVTDEKYVDFKVSWIELATVEVVKKDADTNDKLAGAIFGIYSDADCKNLIIQMPATDKNGTSSVTFVKTQETVYLKEITAPAGYVVNASAFNVKLVAKGNSETVPNKEQLGELTIYKTGEVLTGANVTENGVSFVYTTQKLKGAKYNVTAAEDIKTPAGTVIYKKGAVVAENLTTGDGGSVSLKGLHLGSYTITEVGAPENYYNAGESKTVTLAYAGQSVETVFSETTFHNDRQKAQVSVVKQDVDTENPLPGGIYALYAGNDIKDVNGTVIVEKGTLIEKATTGTDGSALYQADLPINNSYYIKETQAPNLYYRNTTDTYSFRFDYTGEKEASVKFSHTFQNDHVNATIKLVKKDGETGNQPQGDATLEGAVYGLFAKKDINHPDGKTGVLYKAGQKVAELTTDKEGKAQITDLYLGEYFIQEISPSEGYLLDEKSYDLAMDYEGDLTATVEKVCTSNETVIKQPFQIIKAANNGKTDADLLSGVGFRAYLVSSLKTKEDGSYDFDFASPVVIGENGATEIFTDEKGYACSIAVPYGTYVVRETTTPHNYDPVDDFIVKITENHPNEPQVWRVLLDKEFEAKLKITKKDDETHRSVLKAGTEFKVFNLDTKKYVEQVTTYPTVVTHKSYFTDEAGYLILPNNLSIGHYRIEEVNAPYGYTLNENYYEVEVDSNTAFLVDSTSGDTVISVDYENHPVKGELTIQKQGEILKDYDGKFQYEMQPLSGAEFEIIAAEDIYTADFQVDSTGNRYKEYAKGDVVAKVTTDKDGKAVVDNLPLGKYTAKEVHAPEGFVLNTVPQTVEFAYADQDTPVVSQTLAFTDDRQKVSIRVEKQDAENGKTVAGAEFGLYTAEDVTVNGEVIVSADTFLEKAVSGQDGIAAFTLDVPLGKYYVTELKAPAGYVSSDEVISLDASYQGESIPVITVETVKKNEPTTFEFTKADITTGEELEGATLIVLDKDGKEIDKWTSVKGEAHVVKYLEVGQTYMLREEFAPYGYLKAEDVTFTVEDTKEVQKVQMQDEVPTALLIVNKKGEFLDKVTLLDRAKGTVEHLFEYVTGNLTEVTFEVYAAEDVKAADGVSEDYYKADDLVATITTDENGIAQAKDLPVGKYYVKEVGTAYGYVLDEEPRYVDLTYRDQDTPVVVYDEDWQNNRQKVSVHVLKREKGSDRALEGGIFGLYTREDIKSASGKVLLEKDEIIELKATDAEGKITFAADLPVGGKYYVKELYAPDGFVTENEEQDFTFDYQGDSEANVTYDFTFENEPTTVEITKTDLTDGKELPGAHLKVTDENGNTVDEWTSTKEAHIIKELVVGKKYTLTETKPADGYVTAESIEFTIENTAEAQKVRMEDDVTKVEISKQDIAGKELPGAKLTILDKDGKVVESWTSTDKPHYIEMLPIGEYTLREETAPEGYLAANDVKFEVKDTGEVQKVVMVDEAEKPEETPNTPETPVSPDTPKTGDDRHPGLWILLLLLASCTAGGSVWYLRRKKK